MYNVYGTIHVYHTSKTKDGYELKQQETTFSLDFRTYQAPLCEANDLADVGCGSQIK